MSTVSRDAFLNYLTNSAQTLHAEDQRLRLVLESVKARRAVEPADFEALVDAQQVALRIPANMLLMLASMLEADSLGAPGRAGGARPHPPPVALRKRFKLVLLALAGALDHQ